MLVVEALDDKPGLRIRIRCPFVLDVLKKATAVGTVPFSVAEARRYEYFAVDEVVELLFVGRGECFVILGMRDHLCRVDHELLVVDAAQLTVEHIAHGQDC